ncbi:MAG TPA: DEAD/DEAH box helicase [Phenylobacterium sp.]|jgi:replicative superfamily II helicase|nr:DEAD/DEAH box helicase [Phenylobacterium sp.]
MTVRAGFIGIDRYGDPEIRDLSGARRDATALWALIADSLDANDAALLVDEAASRAAALDLLDRTLGEAGPDDVVVLGFAGHGTPDHRLVLADSRMADLPGTTISMADLAERFKTSKARAVVCLLDCCFSGGAPARVVDNAPAARDGALSLTSIAGKGRILFAAAAEDEEALEDPQSRHGYFTQAVIDVLVEAVGEIDALAFVKQVTERVQAAARRTGHVQNPMMFGLIEGALSLPAGRRGARFAVHFPEQAEHQVGAGFADLRAYDLPDEVLALWSARFPTGLNALQQRAVNEFGVLRGQSLLTVAPTSAGKTFVGELAAIQAIAEGRKAVFLLPFKALVNEKYAEFSEVYGKNLGLRIARCSGDWQDQVGPVLRGKYDIAFFTYEKFLAMSLSAPHLLRQLGLVVIDEAQFITARDRGMSVELLLTNLVAARRQGVSPQLVALSAVIGATNGLETWLGCRLLVTRDRPVPLREGVLDRFGAYHFLDADGTEGTEELLGRWDVRVRGKQPSAQDVLVPLAKKLVADGEKIIIFRNQRGASSGCAEYLARELGLPPATAVLASLPTGDTSSTSQRLRNSLAGGVAFHTGDLDREERIAIEGAFRSGDSGVKVLVATSTVAAGVNTPASTVVITETAFSGPGGGTPYSVAEYKNMAGRAGRVGFEAHGRSILLADNAFERERLFRMYVRGAPEAVVSSFDSRHPETWILRLLAQVPSAPRDRIVDLVADTFGGFQATKADATWPTYMATRAEEILDRLAHHGLVEVDDGQSRLTMLGRACAESPLSLESCLQLVALLEPLKGQPRTALDLMVLLEALPERDTDYTPQGRGGESNRPYELGQRHGSELVQALRRRAENDRAYYARCKRALVCGDWIDGMPIQDIEARYTPNAFSPMASADIRGFADGTRYLLDSASRVAALVLGEAAPDDTSVRELLLRLDTGLPPAALPLVNLPAPLTRGERLALFNAGVTDASQLRGLGEEALAQLIGGRALALRLALELDPTAPAEAAP